jgi:anti-sigma B factor antagonist
LNLQYTIEIEDPVIIYHLSGKITSEIDYEEIEKEVFENLNKNYFRIVFDLANLTHTNSSGISFFMRTLTKARIMGGELILTNVTGNVEKIFQISKLDEIYTICENHLEGINHFKNLQ